MVQVEVGEMAQSPCVSLCEVDGEGVCKGCCRTLDEIATWVSMSRAERLETIKAAQKRQLLTGTDD